MGDKCASHTATGLASPALSIVTPHVSNAQISEVIKHLQDTSRNRTSKINLRMQFEADLYHSFSTLKRKTLTFQIRRRSTPCSSGNIFYSMFSIFR